MCGRLIINLSKPILSRHFSCETDDMPPTLTGGAALCPGNPIAVITPNPNATTEAPNSIFAMRWGFAMSEGRKLIYNARAETVHERPTFAKSFESLRCIVPVSTFFEGPASPGGPHPFSPTDARPIALAAIWTIQQDPRDPDTDVPSCAVITCAANSAVGSFHNRMPVIIQPDDLNDWLNIETPVERLQAIMQPREFDDITNHIPEEAPTKPTAGFGYREILLQRFGGRLV